LCGVISIPHPNLSGKLSSRFHLQKSRLNIVSINGRRPESIKHGGNVLTGKEKKALRAAGNLLKPEVWIGKEGVTLGTITNVENTFNTKELVKIKIHESCPLDKKEVGEIISVKTGAELVQTIGRTLLFYRPFPEEAE